VTPHSRVAHEHGADAARQQGFWPRFGFGVEGPPLRGKSVLELGCGTGTRCFALAGAGAGRVVGVDPFEKSILKARESLETQPALRDTVEFHISTIHDLAESDFDAVVSEDAFEHILDLPQTLAAIRARLRVGGRAYIGFGPLYHSPIGDHGWIRAALPFGDRVQVPWGHLIAPKKWIMKRIARREGKPAHNTFDWPFLALNQVTARQFRRLFEESGMRVVSCRSNVNYSLAGRLFGLVGRIPILEKYFTLNMYTILQRV